MERVEVLLYDKDIRELEDRIGELFGQIKDLQYYLERKSKEVSKGRRLS